MKSPDAVDLGQTATWTFQSNTVTLTSALTADVFNCDTAWTLDGGSSLATGGSPKEGSASSGVTVSAAFTGLAAHKSFTTANFSAYTKLSFWLYPTGAISAGEVRIDLCSDTAGATPVNSFTINSALNANMFHCITIDNGSALGSAIQSVAINIVSTIASAPSMYFDNIIVGNNLTLSTLVGKNDGEWYAIQSISGTTIKLDADPQFFISSGTPKGYSGTSGTAEIFSLSSFISSDSTTSILTLTQGGTSASTPITISGGWDTTAMSSQTGDSWFDNLVGQAQGLLGNFNYITVDHLSFTRCNWAIQTNSVGWAVSNISAVACHTGGFNMNGSGTHTFSGTINVIQGNNSVSWSLNNPKTYVSGTTKVLSKQSGGMSLSGSSFTHAGTLTIKNCGGNGIVNGSSANVNFFTVETSYCSSAGFYLNSSFGKTTIGSLTSTNNTTGVQIDNQAQAIISTLTTSNNSQGVSVGASNIGGEVIVNNWTSTSDTTRFSNGATSYSDWRFRSNKEDGTVGNNLIRTDGGTISSQTATRHTASGVAWKLSPTSSTTRDQYYPLTLPVARVAVASGTAITINAWVQRSSNTNLAARIRIPANMVGGVGSSDLIANASAISNTWEQLTLTFTPTENGVVEVFFDTWITNGGNTDSAYIDDFSFS